MLYVGGLFSGASFIDAFAGTDASVGLPYGALLALIITHYIPYSQKIGNIQTGNGMHSERLHCYGPGDSVLTFALT